MAGTYSSTFSFFGTCSLSARSSSSSFVLRLVGKFLGEDNLPIATVPHPSSAPPGNAFIWDLGRGRSVWPVREYPLLGPVQLTYLEVVVVGAVRVSCILCRSMRGSVSGCGLELVHRWRLLRKCHLDVLHLLCAQNVARLTRVRQGRAIRNGGREPGYRNVITVHNHGEVHTDSGWLLVLGGWPDG